jgi:hypothetical protein
MAETLYERSIGKLDAYILSHQDKVMDRINKTLSSKFEDLLVGNSLTKSTDSLLKSILNPIEQKWLNKESGQSLNELLETTHKSLSVKFTNELKKDQTMLDELSQSLKSMKYSFPIALFNKGNRQEKRELKLKEANLKSKIYQHQKLISDIDRSYQKTKQLISKDMANAVNRPISIIEHDLKTKVQMIDYLFKNNIGHSNDEINQKAVNEFLEIQKRVSLQYGVDLFDRDKTQSFVVLDRNNDSKYVVSLPDKYNHMNSFFDPMIITASGGIGSLSMLNKDSDHQIIRAIPDHGKNYERVLEKLKQGKEFVFVGEVEQGKVKQAVIFEQDLTQRPGGQKRDVLYMKEENGMKPLSQGSNTSQFFEKLDVDSKKLAFLSKDEYEKHVSGQEVKIDIEKTQEKVQSLER